jgi:hypothetical protein
MAITNQERVGKAMELLRAGLGPFVEREMRSVYQDKTQAQAALLMGEDRLLAKKPVVEWDAAALLGIDAVLKDGGVTKLSAVKRVVLAWNKISPGNPVTKTAGTVVRTLSRGAR